MVITYLLMPGPIVQSVAIKSQLYDQARPHTFKYIDCEIFSTAMLIQEGLFSVTSETLQDRKFL